jgi:hypothetical protein
MTASRFRLTFYTAAFLWHCSGNNRRHGHLHGTGCEENFKRTSPQQPVPYTVPGRMQISFIRPVPL